MSVLPMKKVRICALKKDRKGILEFMQHQSVMELCPLSEEDGVFKNQDTAAAQNIFDKNSTLAAQALDILDKYAPEKKGMLSALEGRTGITRAEYEEGTADRDRILKKCTEILNLERACRDKKAEIPKKQMELTALEPWMKLDIPLNFRGTRTVAAFVGTFPGRKTGEDLREDIRRELQRDPEKMQEADCPEIDAEIISSGEEQTCAVIYGGKKYEAAIYEALRRINFARPPVSSGNPAEEKMRLEKELQHLRQQADKLESMLKERGADRNRIRFVQDYFHMRSEKYAAIAELVQSSRVFIMEGYMPARDTGRIREELEKRYDVVFEEEEPKPDEDVPVLLSNGAFAAPVESVVESYALPGRGERDPSGLVAVFYYVLFGLMLADAGYGILMVLGCGYALLKFKNMESGMRKSLLMMLYCGISTTILGFVFGSFFGDAVKVVSETFFGRTVVLKALWFEPINSPMKMMVFSFAVGIIHIFTGLGARLYADIRDGHPLDGLYDAGFWYMLVGGLILCLLSSQSMTQMLALTFTLPAAVGQAAKWAAVIGAAGIILTSGRESRNWGKRTAKGLYNLYGVTSYLSDILSYSRLLALGLAAGVISSVFNLMAGMLGKGNGVLGIILFIIVFLIGHTVNFGINALGAYVHTNRLTFVEFFGKFYEGGGRKFNPFSENTQFFKVKEEN